MPDRSHPSPRVGFNAALFSPTRDYRAAGIHRYIVGLLTAQAQDGGVCQTVFAPGAEGRDALRGVIPAADVRAAPAAVRRPFPRIVWEQTALPLALARAGADLYHGAAYAMPMLAGVPAIVTVHDLAFFRVPETFPRAQGFYLRAATRWSARRAAALVAVSAHTRRELIDVLGADPGRVHVVPNGADDTFRPLPPDDVQAWRRRAGLPERFFLTVGTLQPRKNIGTLLAAHARLRADDPTTPDLVVAGAPGWGDDDPVRRVADLGLAGHVHFPGYLPPEDLPRLYNAATVFACPSRYEGFGLPVLEAMACGTPVVVSDASSLPEVAGAAGVLVGPDDTAGWAAALSALAADPDRRAALSAAGLARAARFTWRRAARETTAVYRHVLAGASRVDAPAGRTEAPHGRS